MRGRAVQWRQLVELVARGREISPALRDQALERVAALMQDLPDELLAATSRAIASRSVPAELVALFAARGATASAALLTSAELDHAGWHAVRAVAASDVLPLVNALEPTGAKRDREEPTPQEVEAEPAAELEPEPVPVPVPPAVPVQDAEPGPEPVRVPVPVSVPTVRAVEAEPVPLPAGLFRWETGPTGEIDWVEGAPRAALIGRSLADSFADPFAARLPFADEPVQLAEEGALAGEWRWSGAPAFFPDTGRFAGYRGIAKREGLPADVPPVTTPTVEDDGLRELMHELRTPLNAIIGFGEIIEGQYLGPAHRAYRERAAVIVRQARRLADAVDNLDLAARLRSGREAGDKVTGPEVLARVLNDLREEASRRELRLQVNDRSAESGIALQPQLAERLLRQFGAAMLEPVVTGEQVELVVERKGNKLALSITRATALQGLPEQRLLADRGQGGMRFALRLVQGLATMVGGALDIGPERLVLLLPLAR